jgi:hypothetical protein
LPASTYLSLGWQLPKLATSSPHSARIHNIVIHKTHNHKIHEDDNGEEFDDVMRLPHYTTLSTITPHNDIDDTCIRTVLNLVVVVVGPLLFE